MAVQNIPMLVNLRQNQNTYNNGYGKYYPECDLKEPLGLKGFARHIADHGKLVTYDLAVLVIQNIVSCLKELCSQGQPVKLDGFGTFYPSIEGDGKKVVNTVEGSIEVGVNNLVKGVHLRFLPEGSKGEDLTSRAFKDECVLQLAYVIAAKTKTVDGKKLKYQEKIPISSYAVATATADTTTGGGTTGGQDGPNSGD